MSSKRSMWQVMLNAFGWGGSMAAVRMVTSFISIKVTAVYLGPAGLALVAQFSNFVSLLQSMLGQGLTTGVIRLSSEYGDNTLRRRQVLATACRMGLVLAVAISLVLYFAAPYLSAWLLTDQKYEWLIAVAGLAVAAAMVTDVLLGTLSVSKEIGLIGVATIVSTVLGLAIFAPCSYLWGVTGGLWASFVILIVSMLVTMTIIRYRSQGVVLSEFIGPFDRLACRRLLGFYPMLMVNGVLPMLTLILVRDSLVSLLGLEQAGLWQATWRLSDAYQAAIISGTSMYFMPSMGERVNNPLALRLQLLRTLAAATGATALLALTIFLLREPIVRVVFSAQFHEVSRLMPMQLLGDVLKIAGWILSMSLVAVVRTRAFVTLTALAACTFVGVTKALVPSLGLEGVMWAYLATGLVQVVLGLVLLRDMLLPQRVPLADALVAGPP